MTPPAPEATPGSLRLAAAGPGQVSEARRLATLLAVPFVDDDAASSWPTTGGTLIVDTDAGLEVRFQEADARQQTRVDAAACMQRAVRRARGDLGRDDLLLQAVGLRPDPGHRILDATAGLGRDALLLAATGFDVTAWERSPVVRLLLEQGLVQTAAENDRLARVIATRLHIVGADALDELARAGSAAPEARDRFEVVYLDPMHPPRTKSARVRKELRALQRLVGADADADGLLEPALALARRRVVVKRPTHGKPLAGHEPHRRLRGQKVRFDIYDVS